MIQVHLSGAALRQLGKIREAQVLIDNWRVEYNTFRPHMSLGVPAACSRGRLAPKYCGLPTGPSKKGS